MNCLRTVFAALLSTVMVATVVARKGDFEILNKWDDPIWISLTNGNNWSVYENSGGNKLAVKVKGKGLVSGVDRYFRSDINPDEEMILVIWDKDPGVLEGGSKYGLFGGSTQVTSRKNIKPRNVFQFLHKSGERATNYQNVFVSYNANDKKRGMLYPQTGTYGGLSGTSDSGHSLKNNITAGDIKIKI